jgi:hypothetical protein
MARVFVLPTFISKIQKELGKGRFELTENGVATNST